MARKNVRKNARIDEHILDLFFANRLNPATKLPKDATPAEVHAWFKAQEHRTLATAARRRAHYDVEEAGAAEYHDAEVARLEAELAAGRGRKKRKNPRALRASERDMLDAIEHADLYGDQGWTIDDFVVTPLGEVSMDRIQAFDDFSSWVDVDPEDYEDMSAEERLDQLAEFRGPKWAQRAETWLVDGVPPIVVIDAPDEEGRMHEQIGDGRGRINFALAMGLESLPVVVMRWKHARENPDAARFDADFDEVDDWVTIEECGCHACAPARMNPRAAKRTATGAYADLDSVTLVIENALANYGLSMSNILAVKFTRGGKSRGGACSYSRSLNKCQIMFNGLAWPAFTEEQRLNTVLHEAAHAIQFLTTGTSDHGPKWQKIARSIGCSGDSCMTLEASQAMVDAYAEAKGLEKRKIITREDAEAARSDFAVGDYVSFDHKRERWFGKIVSRGPMHATVMIQSPREGITGKIPYPSLQKEAPPRFAEKVAGVDKPAPGESLSAWQARTGRRAR